MKAHLRITNRFGSLTALATFAILLGAAALTARASQDWDGDNPVGNFSYNNNWFSDIQPTWSSSASLNFHFNNGSATSLYYDYGGFVDTMNIYYVSGFPSALTLNGNGQGINVHARLENDCSFDQVITIPLSMKGDSGDDGSTVQINPVTASLTLSGSLYNDNTKDLNVYGNNGKRLTLNTAWPASNFGVKLLIQQNSIVNIAASQNYTGETDINAGEFWVSTGGALSTSRIYVGNGGTLSTTAKLWLHDGGLSISTPITVNNGNSNTRTIGGLNASGTVTYNGTVTLNGPVNLEANQAGGTVTFATISAGSVQTATATGPGTVVLGGTADNVNLAVAVNSGTVQLNKSAAGGTHAEGGGLTVNSGGTAQLGTSSAGDEIYDSSDVTVNSGGVFDLNGQTETIRNFSLSGTGISSGGALINNNGSTTSTLTVTGTGGTTLGAASSIGGSANITLPNAISGAFNLIKTGAGKVTLSAASGRTTTAGTTEIDNGVLRIQSGTALNTSSSAVTTINNAGVLELNGGITLDQPITFNNGATLRSDGNNINNGKVTVSSAASASATLATVSSGDTFTIGNGANDVSGGSSTSTIHIAGPGTNLLSNTSDYTGNWSVDNGTLLLQSSVADLGATATATLTLNGGGLKLNYSALQTFVAGAGNNVAVTATSTMISDRTVSTANGLTYTFGNLSINGSQLNIVGGANVTGGSNPAGITFGATTLTGSPTFNISNPTAGGSTLLTLGAVNNGANTVTLKGNGKFAQTGVWGAGAGGLTLDATYTGTATLDQLNTYSGGTTLSAGQLNINNSGSSSANSAIGTGTLTISGGTIDNTSSGDVTLAPNNTQNWNGDFTYAGSVHSLNLGTGAVTMNANRQVTVSGNTLTVGGVIGDGGHTYSLTKAGTGTLTLSGVNTYSGGTALTNGQLNINNNNALGNGTFTIITATSTTIDNTSASAVTLANNNPITWSADLTFAGTKDLNLGTGIVSFGSSRKLTLSGSSPLTIGGNFNNTAPSATRVITIQGSGTGNLALNGSINDGSLAPTALTVNSTNAVVTLAGNNNFSGAVTVNAGILRLANNNAAGSGSKNLIANLRTNAFQVDGGITIPSTITFWLSNDGTGGANTVPYALRSVTGVNAIAGTIIMTNGGGGPIVTVDNGSTLNLNGVITNGQSSRSLLLQGGGTGIINGAIVDGGAGASSVIVTNSSGTWTLAGNNTYSGSTTVSSGTLLVNNASGSGAGSGTVTVSSGGTLGGNGSISGATTVGSGSAGTLSPGSSASVGTIGTLSFGSTLTLGSSSTVNMDINKAAGPVYTADKAAVTGAVTYGGTLNVTATGSTLASGDTFTLFSGSGFSGYFSTVTLPSLVSIGGISWDTNKLATTGVLDIYNFTTTPLALSTPVNSNAVIFAAKLANHASSSRAANTYPTGWTAVTAAPSHGTASVDGSGNLTYAPTISYSGSDSFSFTFQDGHGWQTMAVSVTVGNGSGQSLNVLASGTTNGNFYANFAGLPGYTYTVETNAAASGPGWTKEGNHLAPTNNNAGLGIGVFQVMDPAIYPSLFYRTVYPSY